MRLIDEHVLAALSDEDWEAGGSKQSSMLASSISLRTQAHERLYDERSSKSSPDARRPGEGKRGQSSERKESSHRESSQVEFERIQLVET
jgi:hypothetical protein